MCRPKRFVQHGNALHCKKNKWQDSVSRDAVKIELLILEERQRPAHEAEVQEVCAYCKSAVVDVLLGWAETVNKKARSRFIGVQRCLPPVVERCYLFSSSSSCIQSKPATSKKMYARADIEPPLAIMPMR